jgi:peptidoglycan/LPS O-acetylase OafA/YrhL
LNKKIFPQLDGLRGLAAMIVLIHHYWPGSVRWELSRGRIGVDIFFVLSGFLITRTLMRAIQKYPGEPAHVLKYFYIRRFYRLIPVYYVTLMLIFMIPADRTVFLFWHVAFLSNIYFVLQGHFIGASGHLWALSVEQHFYLFWPFVLILTPGKHLAKASAVMIGAGLLFRFIAGIAGVSDLAINILTPTAFETLGAGALLAVWMQGREDAPERLGRWISMLGIFGAAAWTLQAVVAKTPSGPWFHLMLIEFSRGLVLAWVVAQAVWGIPGCIGVFLESAPARAIGRWSYGIFLSHNFFMAIFCARPHHLPLLSLHGSQVALALAATFAWSFACYHLLEKPLLK